MLQVEKTTGKTPQQLLDVPECPNELLYLLNWYREFSGNLTYQEIESWARLTRRHIAWFEVDILMSVDRIKLEVIRENQNA